MIDYEKLKEAEQLFTDMLKFPYHIESHMYLTFNADGQEVIYGLHPQGHYYEGYSDIEDLIFRLKALSPSQPKYKVSDKVWKPTVKHEPWCYTITDIDEDLGYYLNDQSDWYSEDELHLTKQALIESQIAYWTSLLELKDQYCEVSGAKLDNKCKHKSDNTEHQFTDEGGSFTMQKCLKCGEFYR